jgi:hypothetical protein
VIEVKVKYFDTIPPCASMAVLKTGFLFAASEMGNHALYQFIVSHTPLASVCLMPGLSMHCMWTKSICPAGSWARHHASWCGK